MNKAIKYTALLPVALMLSACAGLFSPTSYREAVSVQQVNDKTWAIVARGNSETSRDILEGYSFLRAAEICRRDDFVSFTFFDADTERKTHTTTIGGGGQTTCNPNIHGGVDCNTPHQPQTLTATTYRASGKALFYREKEPVPPDAYDCDITYKQYRHLKGEKK